MLLLLLLGCEVSVAAVVSKTTRSSSVRWLKRCWHCMAQINLMGEAA